MKKQSVEESIVKYYYVIKPFDLLASVEIVL
jgi:hypothetical protein